MNENKKGYWVYSVIAIITGFTLFGFLGYLIYDLFVKITTQPLNNETLVQSIVTLFITVFLGTYYSKWLEQRNAKKVEAFKIQSQIALKIIDYSSMIVRKDNPELARELLICESHKVKLYFDDNVLKNINDFISNSNGYNYDILIGSLKKYFK